MGRRILVAALVAAGLGACGDDDSSATEPSGHDAATAVALCAALRDQTNELVGIANDAVAGIESKTPVDRRRSLLDGFDAAGRSADEFAAALPDLELPAIPEREALAAEVAAGAAAAIREVRQERARFADEVAAVADGDVRGRVGQFFNSIEKVMSVVEPALAAYDRRALQVAFLDEPTCRHVIQPFRLDEPG